MRSALRLDDLLLCMVPVGRRNACVLVAKEERRRPKQRIGIDDDIDMVRMEWGGTPSALACSCVAGSVG
jgi:hypothetical protein